MVRERSGPGRHARTEIRQDSSDGEKPLVIYLVDDDVPFRESLRLLLEVKGYAVEEFGSAEELFAAADWTHRACVLTDVNLPGESGVEILSSIGKMSHPVPVVLMSGRQTDRSRAEAISLGAAAFLEKPVPTAALFAILESVGGRQA